MTNEVNTLVSNLKSEPTTSRVSSSVPISSSGNSNANLGGGSSSSRSSLDTSSGIPMFEVL